LPYIWVAQLFSKGWHLAFDSGGHHLMNPGVASVQIVQIGPLVAARIIAMTMGAVHQALVENETELDTHFTLRSNRQ
jgi:hypothetical protein